MNLKDTFPPSFGIFLGNSFFSPKNEISLKIRKSMPLLENTSVLTVKNYRFLRKAEKLVCYFIEIAQLYQIKTQNLDSSWKGLLARASSLLSILYNKLVNFGGDMTNVLPYLWDTAYKILKLVSILDDQQAPIPINEILHAIEPTAPLNLEKPDPADMGVIFPLSDIEEQPPEPLEHIDDFQDHFDEEALKRELVKSANNTNWRRKLLYESFSSGTLHPDLVEAFGFSQEEIQTIEDAFKGEQSLFHF